MRRSCARGIRTSLCITPIHANKKKKALASFAFISVHLFLIFNIIGTREQLLPILETVSLWNLLFLCLVITSVKSYSE